MDADGQREALGLGDGLRVLTVTVHFVLPLLRDFIMGLGFVDASRDSMQACLSKGLSVGVVVGGAKEALDAHPLSFDLTLERRKGFVKHALRHGAALVPVLTFGENEAFRQVPNPRGSFLRAMQEQIGGTLGWTAPLFYGRGIMQYSCGLLPHRHPLHTVVGPPLSLPKVAAPTDEQVNEWHGKYSLLLQRLYESCSSLFPSMPELLVSDPLAGEMPRPWGGPGSGGADRDGDEDEDEDEDEDASTDDENRDSGLRKRRRRRTDSRGGGGSKLCSSGHTSISSTGSSPPGPGPDGPDASGEGKDDKQNPIAPAPIAPIRAPRSGSGLQGGAWPRNAVVGSDGEGSGGPLTPLRIVA